MCVKHGEITKFYQKLLNILIGKLKKNQKRRKKNTVVSIPLAKHSLKTLRRFIEITKSMEDGAFSTLSNLDNIVKDRNQKNKLYWEIKKKFN